MITELCAHGNLRHLLLKSRIPIENDGSDNSSEYKNVFSTLCHRKLLQIAVDIANGMQHLAAHKVLFFFGIVTFIINQYTVNSKLL